MERSKIIGVAKQVDGQPVIFSPPKERVLGRRVLEWSGHCGTYGQGGPGFFGLRLAATGVYPEEWLMLRLWGADDWLNINGRWLSANPKQYNDTNQPLYSNFHGASWDVFGPLVVGKKVSKFDVHERAFCVEIGDAKIGLTEDPASRPTYAGSKEPRVLSPGDDLRKAWIIAVKPWVRI